MSKIVIIEDNELVARVYERKLTKEGHLAAVALNGADGLEMVEKIKPDLVLVDLLLPDISGVEVISNLRSKPEFFDLTILAYSSDEYLLKQVETVQPTKVISKADVPPREIFNQIESLLKAIKTWEDYEFNKLDYNLAPVNEAAYTDNGSEKLLKRILIVEDDEVIMQVVKKSVEKLGYTAVCAEDGREALRTLSKDSNFAAGIFDVNLPHIKGTDLVKHMRTEKRLLPIPVVIMTASDDSMQIQLDSFSAGATVFIPKPFKKEMLESIINTVIKNPKTVLN